MTTQTILSIFYIHSLKIFLHILLAVDIVDPEFTKKNIKFYWFVSGGVKFVGFDSAIYGRSACDARQTRTSIGKNEQIWSPPTNKNGKLSHASVSSSHCLSLQRFRCQAFMHTFSCMDNFPPLWTLWVGTYMVEVSLFSLSLVPWCVLHGAFTVHVLCKFCSCAERPNVNDRVSILYANAYTIHSMASIVVISISRPDYFIQKKNPFSIASTVHVRSGVTDRPVDWQNPYIYTNHSNESYTIQQSLVHSTDEICWRILMLLLQKVAIMQHMTIDISSPATRKWAAIDTLTVTKKLKKFAKMFYCCRFSCSLFDLLRSPSLMKFSRSLTKIYLTLANIMRIGCVGDGSKLFGAARMTSVCFDSRDYFGFMLRSTEHSQHNQGRKKEKCETEW